MIYRHRAVHITRNVLTALSEHYVKSRPLHLHLQFTTYEKNIVENNSLLPPTLIVAHIGRVLMKEYC